MAHLARFALCLALLTPTAAVAGQVMGQPSPQIAAITATGSSGLNLSWPGSSYAYERQGGSGTSIPARPDQVRVGYNVWSSDGPLIGRIAYVNGRVAVVESATSAMRLRVDDFRIKPNGLVSGVTPAKFEQLAGNYGARR